MKGFSGGIFFPHTIVNASLFLVIFFIIPELLPGQVLEEGTTQNPGFRIFSLIGAKKITGKDLTEDIVLTPVSHTLSRGNILYLSFDAKNPSTLQEESGKYTIKSSSYIRSSDSISGNAAHFSRLENKIIINSTENAWPLMNPSGNFTVEMWIKPYHFYGKNEIFRKMGLIDGKRIGISISIIEGKVKCNLNNLFIDDSENRHSINLISRSSIKINKWTHIAVSMNAVSGKIVLLINDREENAVHAKYGTAVPELKFHPLDHSPFVVGEIYSGIIDELRISDEFRQESLNPNGSVYKPLVLDQRSMRSSQDTAKVISDVLSVPVSRTGKFYYQSDEPEGSILDFKIRTSNKYFYPDTPESDLPWKRIHLKTDRLPPFKHIQWMAEMKSDPEGKHTPVLKEISIRYNIQKKPSTPGDLKYIEPSLENGNICLEWSESPEVRLNQNAGYRIYYGVRSNNYTGRLIYDSSSSLKKLIKGQQANDLVLSEVESHEKKYRPQALNQRLRGKVRQCITNKMVEQNIYLINPSVHMPFFRPMNTYYFSVTSWTEEGGESEMSREIQLVLKDKPDL